MDKKLSEKADQIFDLIIQGINGAVDLTKTEVPKIIEEYVQLFIIREIPIGSFVWFIAATAILIFVSKLEKKHRNAVYPELHYRAGRRTEASEFLPGLKIGVLVAYFAVTSACIYHTLDSVKNIYIIKSAPKAYMIEKFRKHR